MTSSETPKKIYLHIGLHKTGTTYLQNVFRANREQLRAQSLEFPGGPGEPTQALAVWDLQGRRPRGVDDKRIAGQWEALVAHVAASAHPAALISEERLSLSTPKQARAVVAAFGDREVEVIVTARDLGRIAVSAWQEAVKNDATWTWSLFAESIKDPAKQAQSPARGFWMRQDLVKICETWEGVVGAERLTVVTVPKPGASADELLARFCRTVGVDPAGLTADAKWTNETVGVAATEVIRRVNERLEGRLNKHQHDKVVKLTIVQMLARRTEPVRFALPPEELDWVSERADETIAALTDHGYRVVGDLDELRPALRDGSRRPDDATESELLDASLDALSMLSEEYARLWWARRRTAVEEVDQRGGVGSRARAAVFKTQQRAADLADRSPMAAKAVGVVLKTRDRARERARRRKQKSSPPDDGASQAAQAADD
jgi:hypothetical protein